MLKQKKTPKLIGVSLADHATEMQMIGGREGDSFDQRGSFDQRNEKAQSFDDDFDSTIPF